MDIRNFFTRKRKSCDKDDKEDNKTLGPDKKRRKITNSSSNNNNNNKDNEKIKAEEEEAKPNTNDEHKESPKINLESRKKSVESKEDNEDVIIPCIKSLQIKQQPQENHATNSNPINNNDENECMESEESDDDDDIIKKKKNTNSNSKTKNNDNPITESTILTKNKKESILESMKYNPRNLGSGALKYDLLSSLFESAGSTTKRLNKIELMSSLYRSILLSHPSELLQAVYLCCNCIAPPYDCVELGVGDGVILKALCESTGRKLRDIRADYTKHGDLGDVAVKCRSNQNTLFKPKPLTIGGVFIILLKIAKTKGNGSGQEKIRNIQKLFVSATGAEAKYIVRHLQGKLRIGVNEQTVLSAIGRALAFNELLDNPFVKNKNKNNKKLIQKLHDKENHYTALIKLVISQLPCYDIVIPALLKYGINSLLSHCHLTAGVPIKAMLAKPTKGIAEILKRFENIRFTLEYKYDGERAQIHLLPDGTIKIFSRNAEDNTQKFPELIEKLKSKFIDNKKIKSFIIDSEVVAYDRINKTILPFCTLMKRKRKNVQEDDVSISVCIYAFDCLLINNESLINKPFAVRRDDYLYKSFIAHPGELQFADKLDTANPEDILTFLNQSIADKCEGLMVKTLDIDATYEPSKRSLNWLKCKKDYLDGVGDTLDLLVMGAFHGNGKRVGYYGSYLVACYNDDDDTFQSVAKLGTGFKDEDLKNLYNELKTKIATNKPVEYETNFECDVWFEPHSVWEIKCADLTISPIHLGAVGLAHESKGIALRFPRFLRKRDDKTPTNATNSQQIHDMYLNQACI